MADDFDLHATTLETPAGKAFTIEPHATDELDKVTRAVHANHTTTASVVFADDADAVSLELQGGITYPFRLKRVISVSANTVLVGLL